MTDEQLAAIYKRANGEDVGKAQPITTARVFKAMRAMLASPPAEPDMPAICAALGFDPTNHHNAAKCPYCRPQAEQVAQEALDLIADYPIADRKNMDALTLQGIARAARPRGAGEAT